MQLHICHHLLSKAVEQGGKYFSRSLFVAVLHVGKVGSIGKDQTETSLKEANMTALGEMNLKQGCSL